ncbi:MAG: CHAP domain-containing protein [Acidimicrobiales bacterium]|nr:CHAP domain-containing protein [Acidimicrobiales bacterium]MYB80763.1 CHAP domain-containing protein [Acidimicrobiales bacterium]MYI11227.1 CHAP domain-containing protein [Acidimicrobiales bacterium]
MSTSRSVRWGNASNWSNQARRLGIRVDASPAPGAVANWTSSRLGHVAYVESVSSRGDEIVISESNNPGGSCTVSTRTIRRGNRGWPDSFIHFEETR